MNARLFFPKKFPGPAGYHQEEIIHCFLQQRTGSDVVVWIRKFPAFAATEGYIWQLPDTEYQRNGT